MGVICSRAVFFELCNAFNLVLRSSLMTGGAKRGVPNPWLFEEPEETRGLGFDEIREQQQQIIQGTKYPKSVGSETLSDFFIIALDIPYTHWKSEVKLLVFESSWRFCASRYLRIRQTLLSIQVAHGSRDSLLGEGQSSSESDQSRWLWGMCPLPVLHDWGSFSKEKTPFSSYISQFVLFFTFYFILFYWNIVALQCC